MVRCRCCGIPIAHSDGPIRQQVRVCVGCDGCDELHGDKLQGLLWQAVRDGKLAPYTALTRLMIDDAQLTGRLVFVVKDQRVADLLIPHPPPRWLVVAGRCIARNEQPDLQSLVDAVLGTYIPGQVTPDRMSRLKGELLDALQFIDESIMDVEISTDRDMLDPQHLIINIRARTPTLGAVVANAPDVEIPHDILSRKRAEA